MGIAAVAASLAACGARSDLGQLDTSPIDVPPPGDAGPDADTGADVVDDAPRDAPPDAPLNVACGVRGVQPGSPWPMYRMCPSHEGRTRAIGPAKGVVKWSLQLDPQALVGSAAIAADGTIYMATASQLTAVSPAGKIIWQSPLGAWPYQKNPSPAIGADGTIYVGSDALYAVRPDGKLAWSYRLATPDPFGNAVTTAPAIGPDGTIYVGTLENELIAIDPQGNAKWNKNWLGAPSTGFESSPAIGDDGTIYIGDDTGSISAIRPADGSLKWRTPVDSSLGSYCSPTAARGNVFIGGEAELVALVPATGAIAWRSPMSTSPYTKVVSSGPAIGADGTIYVGASAPELFAFTANGSMTWKARLGQDQAYGVSGSPVVDGRGTVYVGTEAKTVNAVGADGQLQWTVPVGDFVESSIAIGADGTLYVGALDGKLYAIGEGG